jgi:dipeptidyl aminopeptidase/acylaminoacyl peptidase
VDRRPEGQDGPAPAGGLGRRRGSARWSPDGKALYFISGRTGGLDQVYRTDAAGETAVQVTKAPFDVGAFKIAPDGKTIVISQAVFPDCDTLDCTKDKLAAKGALKTTGVVYDKLFIRHWDAWNDGLQNHLYALKLDEAGIATGAPVALMNGFNGDAPTKPFGGDEDFAITPDGKSVVFSAKPADREESWSTNYDLWRVPLDGSAKPEPTHRGQQGHGFPAQLLAGRQDHGLAGHEAPGLRGRPHGDHDPRDAKAPRRGARALARPGTARPSRSPGAPTARPSTRPPRTSVRPSCSRSTSSPARSPP